eukprot:COSAG04_NODE_579_length_12424_cov_20.826369_9_plen_356_part_00
MATQRCSLLAVIASSLLGVSEAAIFSADVPTTAACIEVLLAGSPNADPHGWNGSQEVAACNVLSPDRAQCPLITMAGVPGHFAASASGAWQNKGVTLATGGEMTLDYSPILSGKIICPDDGRAEIHWEEIKRKCSSHRRHHGPTPSVGRCCRAAGFWKSATAATASACQECLAGTTRWGTPLLSVVLLAAAAYAGGGGVYRTRVLGKKGAERIPNAAFWLELVSLVKDGVAFAQGGGQRGGGYARVSGGGKGAASDTERGESGRERKEGRGKEGRGKDRREKKEKKEKKDRKERREPESDPEPAASAFTSSAPAPASGTAAGDGGKSPPLCGEVRVSSVLKQLVRRAVGPRSWLR